MTRIGLKFGQVGPKLRSNSADSAHWAVRAKIGEFEPKSDRIGHVLAERIPMFAEIEPEFGRIEPEPAKEPETVVAGRKATRKSFIFVACFSRMIGPMCFQFGSVWNIHQQWTHKHHMIAKCPPPCIRFGPKLVPPAWLDETALAMLLRPPRPRTASISATTSETRTIDSLNLSACYGILFFSSRRHIWLASAGPPDDRVVLVAFRIHVEVAVPESSSI